MSQPRNRVYVIKLSYGNHKSKKKVKVEGGVEPSFQLVPIFGVGVLVDGVLKAYVPVATLEKEDAEKILESYGIPKHTITSTVTEIAEEPRGEVELHLE